MTRHPSQVFSASLGASCFIAVTQILSRGGDLPKVLFCALILFAFSLPILSIVCFVNAPKEVKNTKDMINIILLYLAWLSGIAGIALVFLSFGLPVLLVLLCSTVLALWRYLSWAHKWPSGVAK